MSIKQWEVYIILSKNGKLYTGITCDMDRRFKAHQERKTGARFFHFAEPDKIVYRENSADRSSASKREHVIKNMTRAEKLALIEAYNAENDG